MAIVEGFSAHFHPDPEKQKDPLEEKLEKMGPERTLQSLLSDLDENPDNPETRRQLSLYRNRLTDLLETVNKRISS
jgi:hypothetical protein